MGFLRLSTKRTQFLYNIIYIKYCGLQVSFSLYYCFEVSVVSPGRNPTSSSPTTYLSLETNLRSHITFKPLLSFLCPSLSTSHRNPLHITRFYGNICIVIYIKKSTKASWSWGLMLLHADNPSREKTVL